MRALVVLLFFPLGGASSFSPTPSPIGSADGGLIFERVVHAIGAPILTGCMTFICVQWIATCRGLRSKEDLQKTKSPAFQAYYFCGLVGLSCWAFRLWSIAIYGPVQFGAFRATTVFVRNMGNAIFSGFFFALVWTVLVAGSRVAEIRVPSHAAVLFVMLWFLHVISILVSVACGLAYDQQWGWCIGNVAGFLTFAGSGSVLILATMRLQRTLSAWHARLAKSITRNTKSTNLKRIIRVTALFSTVAFTLCPLFVALFILNIRNTDGFLLSKEAANRHEQELNAIYSIQTFIQIFSGMGAAYYVCFPIRRPNQIQDTSNKQNSTRRRGSWSGTTKNPIKGKSSLMLVTQVSTRPQSPGHPASPIQTNDLESGFIRTPETPTTKAES